MKQNEETPYPWKFLRNQVRQDKNKQAKRQTETAHLANFAVEYT